MTSKTSKTSNRILNAVKTAAAALLAGATALAMTACGDDAGSQASGGANSITLSYSQVVADELPFWIADEAGMFKAQGLDVKLTNLSSSDGFPALISGQTQLASIGAPEMVAGAASGAQVSYLATLTPVFTYELFAKVNNPQELKGKRIGITSTSGSLYIATVEALQQLGLQPSDVSLTPLGSVTNVNNRSSQAPSTPRCPIPLRQPSSKRPATTRCSTSPRRRSRPRT